jgi:hypothetical protein
MLILAKQTLYNSACSNSRQLAKTPDGKFAHDDFISYSRMSHTCNVAKCASAARPCLVYIYEMFNQFNQDVIGIRYTGWIANTNSKTYMYDTKEWTSHSLAESVFY